MKILIRSKDGYGAELKDKVAGYLGSLGHDIIYDLGESCDYAIVIGGDGTLLRDHSKLFCPVLGINPGKSVGFYMAACDRDYKARLDALLSGKEGKTYLISRIMRLEAEMNGKRIGNLILNEILVSSVYVRRIFESRLTMAGRETSERNSGIIVYTPSGSHAFAHSAGASKMPFSSKKYGIVAIAPYSGRLKAGHRELAGGDVAIECSSAKGEVCIDGSEANLIELRNGDVVRVRKSGSPLLLVSFSRRFPLAEAGAGI